MKLTSLRAFVLAIEEGSLRSAARRLDVSQPALTKMIRELERELATTLLQRSTTGVLATAQGKVLYERAVAADRELSHAVEQIQQLGGRMAGSLTIGAVPLAVIGALLALALAAKTLSVFSLMGMIMLVGLVSKNAILLVDFANRAREEGLSMEEALLQARELDEARQASGFDQVALDATARLGFANGAFEDSDEETGAITEEFFPEPAPESPPSTALVAEPLTTPKPTLSTLLKARAEARAQHAAD